MLRGGCEDGDVYYYVNGCSNGRSNGIFWGEEKLLRVSNSGVRGDWSSMRNCQLSGLEK